MTTKKKNKKNEPTQKTMGRPKIPINEDEFKKLCKIQCTLLEIASFFDCCDDTINNWCKETYGETFSVVYKRFSASGKISLRRYQFKLAENNVTMAIWLGKQWLGQRDEVDMNHNVDGSARVVIVDDVPEDGEEYVKQDTDTEEN